MEQARCGSNNGRRSTIWLTFESEKVFKIEQTDVESNNGRRSRVLLTLLWEGGRAKNEFG